MSILNTLSINKADIINTLQFHRTAEKYFNKYSEYNFIMIKGKINN